MKKTKTVKEWIRSNEEEPGVEDTVVDPNYEYCPTDEDSEECEEDCEPEEEIGEELDRALEEYFGTFKAEEQGNCDGDYSEHITTEESYREESISFNPKKQ